MSGYRLTPAAQRDLDDIWNFTADRWDQDQAESYVRHIGSAIERIAAQPRRGRPVDDIRTGYRRAAAGSHLVYYLERDGTVDVIRILHQRTDPSRHL